MESVLFCGNHAVLNHKPNHNSCSNIYSRVQALNKTLNYSIYEEVGVAACKKGSTDTWFLIYMININQCSFRNVCFLRVKSKIIKIEQNEKKMWCRERNGVREKTHSWMHPVAQIQTLPSRTQGETQAQAEGTRQPPGDGRAGGAAQRLRWLTPTLTLSWTWSSYRP